jgi:endogenous inhibitor of DNA gyrase (YacG/DUF329 family)
MKPVDWNNERVHLQCPACGQATGMGARAYFWALGRGVQVGCPGCGTATPVEDRRQAALNVTEDRRVAATA